MQVSIIRQMLISAIIIFLSACTFIKMGGLFLSGHFEQRQFFTEIDISIRRGLILVPVHINNATKTYSFILDTGSAFNVVSTAIARELNLHPQAADTFVDAARRSEKIDFTKIEQISLGGVHFERTAAAIFNIDRTPEFRCYDADGAIGMNLMRFVPYWHIDYRRKKLIITDQKNRLPQHQPCYVLPFHQDIQRIPKITLQWYEMQLPFIVDLGSTLGFNAPWAYWEKIKNRHRGIRTVEGYGEKTAGALGTETGQYRTAILEHVRIGDFQASSMLFHFSRSTFASIGNDFFCRFTVTIDLDKKKILLFPGEESEQKAVLKGFGFGYSFDESKHLFYVSFLYKGSAAEVAGIKIGDRILQINDIKLESPTLDDYCRFFVYPQMLFGDGDTVTIQVQRNGQNHTHTLSKEILLQ